MLWEAIHADVAVAREPPEEVGLRRERTRQRARGEENGGAAGAEEAHGTARHGTDSPTPTSAYVYCSHHWRTALHSTAPHCTGAAAVALRRAGAGSGGGGCRGGGRLGGALPHHPRT